MFEYTHKKLALASAIGAILLVSNAANAHVTYNTADNGVGNVPDGSGAAIWTDGAPISVGPSAGYTGNLPATWAAMIENAGGVADSLTASSADSAAAGGYATIGIGAKSYRDGSTNWGHSADFGLFSLQHAATVTITVSSDNSNLRPAFGLWDGWDTSGASSRHQSYLNNGALNAMGSVLDSSLVPHDATAWTFAASQGPTATATLTRYLAAGDYTLILGGYNGTSPGGNLAYTATIYAAPVPLPAGIWLFGSALMGYLGLQKRKMAA